MPWDAKSFASRHNRKLLAKPAVAKGAARQANAMLKAGVPEGVAIATASKRANKVSKAPSKTTRPARAKAKPGLINSEA